MIPWEALQLVCAKSYEEAWEWYVHRPRCHPNAYAFVDSVGGLVYRLPCAHGYWGLYPRCPLAILLCELVGLVRVVVDIQVYVVETW